MMQLLPCCPAAARCACSAGWLCAGTVHFFLNSSATGRGFPLYTRAIRLAHNREGMVRAAVRTLTLNVYSVPDPDIIAFVTSPPACQYFADMAQYLAEQVQVGGANPSLPPSLPPKKKLWGGCVFSSVRCWEEAGGRAPVGGAVARGLSAGWGGAAAVRS